MLAILGAMHEEVSALVALIREPRIAERAGRVFTSGLIGDSPVTVAFSRWGKVAAASTVTEAIVAHRANRLVFCGVAGGLDPGLRIGDVVVADRLVQYDLDASPFFPPTEIPLLGRAAIETDPDMSRGLSTAAQQFLAQNPRLFRAGRELQVARGTIASGDQVIRDERGRMGVLGRVPGALAVEMEGAAAAQVCLEHGVPFACIRTISDTADEHIAASLPEFLGGLAASYTAGVVRQWLSG